MSGPSAQDCQNSEVSNLTKKPHISVEEELLCKANSLPLCEEGVEWSHAGQALQQFPSPALPF